jgi:hypothetical protein
MPSSNGMRVFDAETQETSYGIWILDGLPYIFDTHRAEGRFVATIELLTEVVKPIRIGREKIQRFSNEIQKHGLLPIPYSACFFQGNLHVYAFSGPVRGFDVASIGRSAAASERTLRRQIELLWPRVPDALRKAQGGLFNGRVRARYPADLQVLRRHVKSAGSARSGKDRTRGRDRRP